MAWVSAAMGLGAILLVPAVLALVMRHPEGRTYLVRQALAIANDDLKGRIEVEAVDELRFDSLTARGVSIRDDRGDEVIHVARARLDLDLLALASGELSVDAAEAEDAQVNIIARANGEYGIAEAFENPRPEPSPPPPVSSENDGFVVRFHRITAHDVDVRVVVPGDVRVVASGVDARVGISTLHGTVVTFETDGGRGRLTEPLALEAPLRSVDGRYAAREDRRLHVRVIASVGDEPFTTTVSLVPDGADGHRVEIRTAPGGPLGALAALGVDVFRAVDAVVP